MLVNRNYHYRYSELKNGINRIRNNNLLIFFSKMTHLVDHYKNICSSETIHSHKKGFYREFCELTKQSIGIDYLENIFRNIQLDEERLLNIFFDEHISIKLFNMLNKISQIYKKKDALHSKKIRMECFNLKDVKKITNCLTELNKAVIFAPEIGMSNNL